MGTAAQVDERPTAVDSGCVILDALVDNAQFEFVVRKHLQQIGLLHDKSLKRLITQEREQRNEHHTQTH